MWASMTRLLLGMLLAHALFILLVLGLAMREYGYVGLKWYFNEKALQTYLYCVPFTSTMNKFGMTATSKC